VCFGAPSIRLFLSWLRPRRANLRFTEHLEFNDFKDFCNKKIDVFRGSYQQNSSSFVKTRPFQTVEGFEPTNAKPTNADVSQPATATRSHFVPQANAEPNETSLLDAFRRLPADDQNRLLQIAEALADAATTTKAN
jgi:hypothetical protein